MIAYTMLVTGEGLKLGAPPSGKPEARAVGRNRWRFMT